MRRVLPLLALVLALVGAGCGGGGDDGGGGGAKTTTANDKQAYAKQLQQASATLQKTFGDISDQTGSNTSSKQIGDRLAKGADAVDKAADKFATITPPAAAKDAHQKLVDGLHEIADELRTAATAAQNNDSKTLATALKSLLQGDGAKKLNEATAALKAQGLTPDASSAAPSSTTTTG
jgi:uncharacterized protein YukE